MQEAENETGAVWKRTKDLGRFMEARDGDMMLAPFQCDYCWFINLNGRPALEGARSDERLLGYIQRVKLDIMWSQEPGTVKNNMYQYNKIKQLSHELARH